ncbi:acetyl-CoA synthetase-like protein [Tilletiaria anomala UBC 951]|uniref:Acetyl-CoA synthetase-like protein n=1 Tax=Tilletiaria anomala (strain ATCC 24038 / CBS 436.72 / UBC 951) TaxID=1037660 RepID=A0A066VBJ6_TILAU|nr:acetyl-CoA synthetase-like protein [Tilletiaria anomala UBC 951]KDN37673.1 acetyl-CoA synthetase-like protein [Tilletiaria anomala UBC 951]
MATPAPSLGHLVHDTTIQVARLAAFLWCQVNAVAEVAICICMEQRPESAAEPPQPHICSYHNPVSGTMGALSLTTCETHVDFNLVVSAPAENQGLDRPTHPPCKAPTIYVAQPHGQHGGALAFAAEVLRGLDGGVCAAVATMLNHALAWPELGAVYHTGSTVPLVQHLADILGTSVFAPPSRAEHRFSAHTGGDFWHVFCRNVERHSCKIAIQEGDETFLTYKDLWQLACNTAVRIGVKRDESHAEVPVVAILAERSIEAIAGQLAAMAAGVAFVYLSPQLPLPRLQRIVDDCAPLLLIHTDAEAAIARQLSLPLDTCLPSSLAFAPPSPQGLKSLSMLSYSPQEPAYLVYTSGTTSVPKGVIIPRSALASYLKASLGLWGQRWYDRRLAVASLLFDVSICDVFGSLACASCIVLRPQARLLDGLGRQLLSDRISFVQLTPTVASLVSNPSSLANVRTIILSGEPVPPRLASWFVQQGIDGVWNGYGPSEATVVTLAHRFASNTQLGFSPIGLPLGDTRAVILAPDTGEVVPRGFAGHLCLLGPQLALGYLKRPELTGEAFVAEGRDRYYYTGDLARFRRESDSIECMGRLDRQVKLNGLRIQVEEIEASAREVVEACAVLVVGVAPAKLACFYLLPKGESKKQTEGLLRAHLERDLPAYMVPTVLMALEDWSIALTPTGKVDGNSLCRIWQASVSAPFAQSNDDGKDPQSGAPLDTAEEEAIANAWAQVLPPLSGDCYNARLDKHSNIFQAGADSIGLIRLSNVLAQLGWSLGSAEMLETDGSIQEMASRLRMGSATNQSRAGAEELQAAYQPWSLAPGGGTTTTINDQERFTDAFPLQLSQLAMLAASLRHEGPDAPYSASYCLSLPSGIDLDQVEAACTALVGRHPSLRTVFFSSGEGLYQAVLKPGQSRIRFTQSNDDLDVSTPASLWMHIHHAIFDGWSLNIILDDLEALLQGPRLPADQALLSGSEFPAFVDHSKRLRTERAKESLDFWRKMLAPLEGLLWPPHQRSDGSRPRTDALVQARLKSPRLAAGARRVHPRATPAILVSVALAIALKYHAHAKAAVFWAVSSGRTESPYAHRASGCYVATLPVKVDLTGNATLHDILAQVAAQQIEALRHEQSQLDTQLRPDPQCLLTFQNFPARQTPAPQLQIRSQDMARDYTLCLDAFPCPENGMIKFDLHFDTTLVTESEAVTFLEHVIYFLDALCESSPGDTLSSVAGALAREEGVNFSALHSYRDNAGAAPAGDTQGLSSFCSIVDALLAAATRVPRKIALSFEDRVFLEYRELEQRTSAVALGLAKLGVGRGDTVLVRMDRGIDQIVAIYGVIRCGAAMVPLDPAFSQERQEFLARDSGARIVLVESKDVEQAPELSDATVKQLSEVETATTVPGVLDSRRLEMIQPNDVAYRLYTSGTTGQPKAVEIPHSALMSFVEATSLYRQMWTSRRLAVAAFTFDVSVHDWAATLSLGATLCISSSDRLFGDITHTLNTLRVSSAQMTPTVASLIDAERLQHLDTLILSGEPLSAALRNKFVGKLNFFNSYGPTETTVDVCSHRFEPSDVDVPFVPIGRPMGFNELLVVDPDTLQPMPLLCPGELLIGGPQVGLGYANRSELTKKHFVLHAAWPGASAKRLYRTGDLCRLHLNGLMQHMGRIDSQVKLQGRRIEVEEIESVITAALDTHQQQQHELRRPQVCVSIVDKGGSQSLAAWISYSTAAKGPVEGGATITWLPQAEAERVLEHCRRTLPRYMVPRDLYLVQDMPVTASGKVDRRGLARSTRLDLSSPPRDADKSVSEANTHAAQRGITRSARRKPSSRFAGLLCQAYTSVFDRWINDENADFSELGGDSISVIRILASLRSLLAKGEELELRPSHFFQLRTIGDLAAFWNQQTTRQAGGSGADDICERRASSSDGNASNSTPSVSTEEVKSAAHVASLRPEDIEEAYPAVRLQEGLVSLSLQDPSLYFATFRWKLSPGINPDRVLQAWTTVVSRRPMLRTVFVPSDHGRILQLVLKASASASSTAPHPTSFNWGVVPLMATIERGESTSPSLSPSPSFRLDIHHALYDGWTLKLLLADLCSAYYNELLPERPSFASVQAIEEASDMTKHMAFWARELEGSPVPNWPCRPHARLKADHRATVHVDVARLDQLVSQARLSAATVVETALALVMARYADAQDVIFDVVSSGRSGARSVVANIDQILGPCVVTYPLRVRLDRYASISDLVRGLLQHQSDELVHHEAAGLTNIVKAAKLPAAQQISSTLLTLSAENGSRSKQQPLFEGAVTSSMRRNYAVCLDVDVGPDGIDFDVHFDPATIVRQDACQLAAHVGHAVYAILTSGDTSLDTFRLFGPADQQIVSDMERDTQQRSNQLQREPLLLAHQYLEAHARTSPSKIALQYQDRFITYAEFEQRASMRAKSIRVRLVEASGSGKQRLPLVPIIADKDDDFVINAFAVLKAGGAYVPISPYWPSGRRNEVLRRTAAAFAITKADLVEQLRRETKGQCEPLTAECLEQQQQQQHQPSLQSNGDISLPFTAPDNASDRVDFYGPDEARLAYLLFTSGTTGTPKGVQVTANNLAAFLRGASHRYQPYTSAWTRRGSFAAQTFDVSCHDIFGAVAAGSSLCMAPSLEMQLDLQHTLEELRVSLIQLTPSVAQILDYTGLPHLQALITSGEALPASLVVGVTQHVPLFNSNGPTEATVDYSSRLYSALPSTPNEAVGEYQEPWVSVGTPIGFSRFYVLDSQQRLCATGEPGEVVVAGPQVAAGYLDMSGETAKAFYRHPQLGDIYATGDRGILHANGELQLLGRRDGQVKIRGLRIELGEIAAVLERATLVAAAAVYLDPDNAEQIAAFIATKHSVGDLSSDQVAARVRVEAARSLAPYMMPASITVVGTELPITSSGKVDKSALFDGERRTRTQHRNRPAIAVQERANLEASVSAAQPTSSVAPTEKALEAQTDHTTLTPVQQAVRSAWASVLQVSERVLDLHTTWSAAGGDSIQMIRLFSACRRAGISLLPGSGTTIFEQALTAKVGKELLSGSAAAPGSGESDTVRNVVLSPIQRHFFAKTGPIDHYNQSMLLQLHSSVDSLHLAKSLDTLVRRHAQLRASFTRTKRGRVMQHLLPPAQALGWPVNTVGDREIEDIDEINRLLQQQSASLKVFAEPPQHASSLLAALVFTFQGRRHAFLTAHHLVVDLVSWNVLLDALMEMLAASDNGISKRVAEQKKEKEANFAAFSAAMFKEIRSVVLQGDGPRFTQVIPEQQQAHGDGHPISVGEWETSVFSIGPLSQSCIRRRHLETLDIMLAALALAIRETRGEHTPVIALEGHGRDVLPPSSQVELDAAVGWFTNISPLSLPTSDSSIEATLRGIRDARLAGLEPLLGAAELGALAPASQHAPRWPLLFNLHSKSASSPTHDGPFELMSTGACSARGFQWTDVGYQAVRDAALAIDVEPDVLNPASFIVEMHHRSHASDSVQCLGLALQTAVIAIDRHNREAVSKPLTCIPDLCRSDLFPHLMLNREQFNRLTKDTLLQAGIRLDQVADLVRALPTQQALVWETQRAPGAYITSRTFNFAEGDAPNAVWRLQSAVERLVDAHPILLRSRFVLDRDLGLLIAVLRAGCAPTVWFDRMDDDDSSDEALQHVGDPFLQPFGVVLRRHGPQRQVVAEVRIHHALVDAWTMHILVQDLGALLVDPCAEPNRGRLQFKTYLLQMATKDRTVSRSFWTRLLQDLKAVSSTPAFAERRRALKDSRPLAARMARVRQQFCIPRDQLEDTGVSESTIFLLAWGVVLAAHSRQRSVVTGLILSGRDGAIPGIDNMAGPTITTLPLPISLRADWDLQSQLLQLERAVALVSQHADVGLAEVASWAGWPADALTSFATFRNLPGDDGRTASDSLVELEELAEDNEQVPVSVAAGAGTERHWLELNYNSTMFDAQEAKALANDTCSIWKKLLTKGGHKDVDALIGFVQPVPRAPAAVADLHRQFDGIGSQSPVSAAAGTEPKPEFKLSTELGAQLEQKSATTGLREQLERIWCDVLAIPEQRCPHDVPFSELGGSSLASMRLISAMRNAGIKANVSDLLQANTISCLATRLLGKARQQDNATHASTSKIKPGFTVVSRQAEADTAVLDSASCQEPASAAEDSPPADAEAFSTFECTPVQLAVLSAASVHDDTIQTITDDSDSASPLRSTPYCAELTFSVRSDIDPVRLKRAFHCLVDSHDILRTAFVASEGDKEGGASFRAICYPPGSPRIPSLELDTTTSAHQDPLPTATGTVAWKAALQGRKLVWHISHALYDGATLDIFLRDLDILYTQLGLPHAVGVADLGVSRHSYAKFAKVANRWADDQAAASFWSQRLAGASLTQLWPSVADNVPCATNQIEIDSEGSLETAASRLGCLPGALVRAAVGLLLCQLHETDHVVFDWVSSGRSVPGFDETAGPMVATYPANVTINRQEDDAAETIQQIATRIQEELIQEMQHEHFGMNRILRAAKLSGQRSQLLVTYQAPAVRRPKERIVEFERGSMTLDYVVSLEVQDRTALVGRPSFRTTTVYDAQVLSRGDAISLTQQLGYLLGALSKAAPLDTASSPSARLLSLSMGPTELETAHGLCSADARLSGSWPLLHDLVIQQSVATPRKVALQFNDEFVTYAQLVLRAQWVADHIVAAFGKDRRSGRQPCIGVSMSRGIDMVLALLGVLMAGAAYVPLDPDLPHTRYQLAIRATGAKLVLASQDIVSANVSHVDASDVEFVTLSELAKRANQQQQLRERPDSITAVVQPNDLAYVIPTSGSTGTPKACAIEHRNVSAFLTAATRFYGLTAFSRKLQAANFTFDVSVFDIWGTLSVGGCVILAPRGELFGDMAGVINKTSATFLDLTPTLASLLSPSSLPTVSSILFGGEALPRKILKTWISEPGVAVFNASAPTECVVNALAHRFNRSSAHLPYIPIGRALGHSRIYLLDNQMRPVRLGQVGEIYIGGPQVGRGYLGDEEKTRQSFLRDVTIKIGRITFHEERLFRSGDTAKLHGEGLVEHLGRRDHQVKLKGLRIELGDIESQLSSLPGVRLAAVQKAVAPGGGGILSKETLIGFVELQAAHDGGQADATTSEARVPLVERLLADLQLRLPSYMVPESIELVPNLPLTPSGKVDRKDLKRLADALLAKAGANRTDAMRSDTTAPEDEIEAKLVELSAKILGHAAKHVSTTAGWSHLGGDSIASIQLISACRKAFGTRLAFGSVLRSTTLRQVAAMVRRSTKATTGAQNADAASSLERSDSSRALCVPLTPLQRRFVHLFGAEGESGLEHYSQSHLISLRGRASSWTREELEMMLRNIEDRHAALSCTLTPHGMSQGLRPRRRLTLHQEAIATCKDLGVVCSATIHRVSLAESRLFEATLIEVGAGSQKFVMLTAHHFVVDIVSWQIILGDLASQLSSGPAISALGQATDTFLSWSQDHDKHPGHITKVSIQPLEQLSTSSSSALAQRGGVVSNSQEVKLDVAWFCASREIDLEHLMVAALTCSLRDTATCRMSCTASSSVTLAVESHGREPWLQVQDVTRTVGWLSAFYAASLDLSAIEDPITALVSAKDALCVAKRRGYCLPDGEALWPVVMNYHGRRAASLAADSTVFNDVDLPTREGGHGLVRDAIINVEIELSADGRKLDWTVEGPACLNTKVSAVSMGIKAALNTIIMHVAPSNRPSRLGLTLVDISVELDAPAYDELRKGIIPSLGLVPWQLERVTGCTPLQTALVAAGDGSDRYRSHREYQVSASRNVTSAALARAWKAVVRSTDVLRSRFAYHSTLGLMCLVLAPSEEASVFISRDATEYQAWLTFQGDPGRSPVAAAILEDESGIVQKLCLAIHHAATDAWTNNLIEQDLVNACHAGPEMLSPSPSFQAVLDWYKKQDPAQSCAFWTDYLSGMPESPWPVATIEARQALVASSPPVFERAWSRTPGCVSAALERMAQQFGVLASDLLQLTWAVCLHRRSLQDVGAAPADVCFGIVLSGRDVAVDNIEEIRGPCIQTVVARYTFEHTERVHDVLKRMQNMQDRAKTHAWVGLDGILRATPAGSIHDLVRTLVTYRNLPGDSDKDDNIKGVARMLRQVDSDDRITIPISVTAYPAGAGADAVEFDLLYDTMAVAPCDAVCLADELAHTFVELMRALESGNSFASVEPLPEKQMELVQNSCTSRADATLAPATDLVSLLLAQTQRYPSKICIQQRDTFLTYRDVERKSEQLARRIRRYGLPLNSMVPLRFHKDHRLLLAILGVLRAGHAYVPIDPELPEQRQNFLIQQVQARLVVQDQASHPALPPLDKLPCTVATFEALMGEAEAEQSAVHDEDDDHDYAASLPVPSFDDACYVIYTSGSTGTPKGCVVKHGNVAQYCTSYASANAVPSDWTDRTLTISNTSFDASICEYFVSLVTGATVCFATKDQILSDLLGQVNHLRITTGFMTPSLCRTADFAGQAPTLKRWSLGGEMVPRDLVEALSKGGIEVYTGYGPTETTVMVVTGRLDTGNVAGFLPLGRPNPGTFLRIVDGFGRTCPAGATGELMIGGGQVSAGYLDIESDSFFTDKNGVRWYRTGDYACLHGDGRIQILGRRDAQIKLRGQRIDLGEVEAAATSLDDVAEAAVELVGDTLVGGFCPATGRHARECTHELKHNLVQRCQERVPPFAVPEHWVALERLPRTQNDKLDRNALRKWLDAAIKAAAQRQEEKKRTTTTDEAPRTEHEERIAQAWARALGIEAESIGLDDNFTALGGDSIKAVRAATYLRATAPSDTSSSGTVSVAAMLRCRTVRAYAVELARATREHIAAAASLVNAHPGSDSSPSITVLKPARTSSRRMQRFGLLSQTRKPMIG